MSKESGIGVPFKEVVTSVDDSVRNTSLLKVRKAVRDGGIPGKLKGCFDGCKFQMVEGFKDFNGKVFV